MRLFTIGLLLVTTLAPAAAWAQDDEVPRAKPIGSPGTWIPANSYPEMAKRSAEEGKVSFVLEVDETGRVTDCKITQTSDSPLLDETTCALMSANGRFEVARDKKNKPVPSRWSSSVTWRLDRAPDPAPPSAGAPAPAGAPGKP